MDGRHVFLGAFIAALPTLACSRVTYFIG